MEKDTMVVSIEVKTWKGYHGSLYRSKNMKKIPRRSL